MKEDSAGCNRFLADLKLPLGSPLPLCDRHWCFFVGGDLLEYRAARRQQYIVRLDVHQSRAAHLEKQFKQLECVAPVRRQT